MWEEADLDILVKALNDPDDFDELNSLGFYLQEYEGYKKERAPDMVDAAQGPYHDPELDKVETYLRKVLDEQKPRKIQIIYTHDNPIHLILDSFHSTAVINFITWGHAYCVFPDVTFIKKKSYHLNCLTELQSAEIINKYSRRGWEFAKNVEEGDEKATSSMVLPKECQRKRRIGDSYSWCHTLDTTSIDVRVVPSIVLYYSTFSLKTHRNLVTQNRGVPGYYRLMAHVFKSCVLKHDYIGVHPRVFMPPMFPSFDHVDSGDFWASMEQKLDDLTHAKPLKFPEEERPIPIRLDGDPPQTIDGGFQVVPLIRRVRGRYSCNADLVSGNEPEGWTFYDAEISGWYEQYLREKAIEEAEQAMIPLRNSGGFMSNRHNPTDVSSAETALAALQIEDAVPVSGGHSAE